MIPRRVARGIAAVAAVVALLGALQTARALDIPPPVSIDVSESVGVSDGQAVVPPALIAIAEGLSVGDAVKVLPPALASVAESLSVADAVSVLPPAVVAVAEAVGVTDTATVKVLDTVPPTTTATLIPAPNADGWNGGAVTVRLVATDNPGGVGVKSITYSATGAQPIASTTVDAATVDVPITAEGVTTLSFQAQDQYLNTEVIKATVVRIDKTAPVVTLRSPQPNEALQDGVTLLATATDATSGVKAVYFTVREADGGSGKAIGYERVPGTRNADGTWQITLDTTKLPDGFYLVTVEAVDLAGNSGWTSYNGGKAVPFGISNWAVVELLPASQSNQAGRTMPVKFAIRVSASVDSSQPFVHNEDLTIRIYATAQPSKILQTSTYGSTATSYRIDDVAGLYITNFKTLKSPTSYTVEVLRKGALIGSFTFATT